MIVLALIVGAILGAAALQSAGGAVVGGVIGFLVFQIAELRTRVKALEQAGAREAAPKTEAPATAPQPAPAVPSPPLTAAATDTPKPPPTVPAAAPPPLHAAPPPPPPPEPSILDDAVRVVRNFFTEGNTVARVGIVVLFFGVAFLLKYAAEHARLPIELRLAALVLGWELQWQTSQFLPRSDWAEAILAVFLAALLAVPLAYRTRFWPLTEHARAYLLIGAIPVVLLSLAWVWTYGTFQPGNAAPLPYVPLLNPLDLAAMFVLLALFVWAYRTRALTAVSLEAVATVLGVTAFIWLNAALFRALHHYAGLRYTVAAIYDSTLAQAAVAIFWTVLAFALMLVAKSLRLRQLWLIGAALLGVVVVKLFLVDLSGTGTVERIVSFVGVGVLLLVIGYLVPVPPRTAESREARA